MAQQISLLLPHLGGEAHVLRCGIVTAIGYLLQTGFENAPGEAADAQGDSSLASQSSTSPAFDSNVSMYAGTL
jgi:hypothetical protein